MSAIHITNFIAAPTEIVYDLSRHMMLQKKSMEMVGINQIRGISSGLVSVGDTTMWRISVMKKPFFFSLKIAENSPFNQFTEMMSAGPLESFEHTRHFKSIKNGTLVIDEINYELPKRFWSKFIDTFFLRNQLMDLLTARNKVLKEYAESTKWKALLIK
jgi:ligand-binding SRPBCC domain-containing protein